MKMSPPLGNRKTERCDDLHENFDQSGGAYHQNFLIAVDNENNEEEIHAEK
jgi:hypothetical protein